MIPLLCVEVMNSTNTTEATPEEFLPPYVQVIFYIIYGFIFISGSIGNTLVIYIIGFRKIKVGIILNYFFYSVLTYDIK